MNSNEKAAKKFRVRLFIHRLLFSVGNLDWHCWLARCKGGRIQRLHGTNFHPPSPGAARRRSHIKMVCFRVFWWYYFAHVYIWGPKKQITGWFRGSKFLHPKGAHSPMSPLSIRHWSCISPHCSGCLKITRLI